MARGKIRYIPPNVDSEVTKLMQTQGIKKRTDAYCTLGNYARIGMEAERLFNGLTGNFRRKKK